MATQVSSDAQKVLSGATQEAIDYAKQNAPGNVLTSGEATNLLGKFGNLNPNGVFSTSNVVGASTAPKQRPDDLMGIRSQIQSELGLPGLQQQYQDIFGRLQAFDQAATGTQIGLENQPVALNVIRGQQAEAGRQSAFQREGLARQAQVTQSALQAAQQEASDRFAIRQQEVNLKRQLILENPGAGITFGDSVESAAKKIKKYQDKLVKEEQKRQEEMSKKEEKSRLKDMAMQLGVSTKGSRKELRDRISAQYKSDKDFERALKSQESSGASSGASAKADAAKEKAFWSTADKLKSQLANEKINWAQAWETLASRNPEIIAQGQEGINFIDNALGLSYRDRYNK